MMGGSTSNLWRVCMASHRLGYWQTSCLNNVWWHGASTNAISPSGCGEMSGGWSLFCKWWTILELNMREITMKSPLTGLANFFVECHSSGITLTYELICPFQLTLQKLSPFPTCHTITPTTCSSLTQTHQYGTPEQTVPVEMSPPYHLLKSNRYSILLAHSHIIPMQLAQPWQ